MRQSHPSGCVDLQHALSFHGVMIGESRWTIKTLISIVLATGTRSTGQGAPGNKGGAKLLRRDSNAECAAARQFLLSLLSLPVSWAATGAAPH